MKRWAAIGAALLMAAACGSDSPTTPSSGNTGPITFTATLSAASEVPPITNAEANARGTVTITFNVPRDASGAVTGAGTVTFVAQLASFPAGTPATLAHIHTGAAGIAGGVLINTNLSAASPIVMDANGSGNLNISNIPISQTDATNIAANPAGFYFNVHTSLNPSGAVRGQLVKQ